MSCTTKPEIIDLPIRKLYDGEEIRGVQLREFTDPETVAEYAEAIEAGDEFPPVDAFRDPEGLYHLAHGFHRLEAHVAARRKTIRAEIHLGTARDAILFAVSQNQRHGLKRSAADKRKAVETLLGDDEWSKWAAREIARLCGVSEWLVREIKTAQAAYLQVLADRPVTVQRGTSVYLQQPKRFKDMLPKEKAEAVRAAEAEHPSLCPTCGQAWPEEERA